MYGCEMSGFGGSFMGWGLGAVVMLAFWGLLIGAAIYVIRHLVARDSRAEQELARRFAAGEISDDEYRERLATIRDAGTGTGWRA